jgi:uncharacterized protein YqgV (UPF0045/DUF77 family)
VRLEAEFTSEPFHGEGSPPQHALAARDAATEAGLDTDFGPFGTLASGDAKELLKALPAIAQAALDGGATRVTLQVRRPDDAGSAGITELTDAGSGTAAEPTDHERGPTGQAKRRTGELTGTGSSAANPPVSDAAERPPREPDSGGAPAVELTDALARLIADVERELGSELGELDRPGKQRAVRLLRERGAFGLRKSVSSVADALGVTRFTVYNYLNREAD